MFTQGPQIIKGHFQANGSTSVLESMKKVYKSVNTFLTSGRGLGPP